MTYRAKLSVLSLALHMGCGGTAEQRKCPEPEPVIAKDCAVLDESDQLVFVDCATLDGGAPGRP